MDAIVWNKTHCPWCERPFGGDEEWNWAVMLTKSNLIAATNYAAGLCWARDNGDDCMDEPDDRDTRLIAVLSERDALRADLELAKNQRDDALDAFDASLAHRDVLNARILELEAAARALCKELRVTHDNGVIEYDSQEHETMERLLRRPAPGGDA